MDGTISVLLLIYFILKSTVADYSCKSESGICSINRQNISASDPFSVTRNNSSSITSLVIADGFMPEAPHTIFTKYPEIIWFSISNTSLQELSSDVFTNAFNLAFLVILDGFLTTLHNGTFSYCVKLQSLQVTDQQITSIDIMAFQELKSLQNLFLNNNQLSSLHPLILSVLPKLMYFSIKNNLLTTIDSQQFVNNPTLYSVMLSGNQIKTLPNDLFQSQARLSSFYADHNQLVTVQSYGASYVDVSFNKLRNFTISSGETTVHIENNFIRKIICSNTNLTVQRFYADNNLLTNFQCIRDMVNLTDLSIINNKMSKPSKKVFLKLGNLVSFQMYNMTRFSSVPAKIFTPLSSLSNLRVDRLAAYKNFNITIPKLYILGLTTVTWNCTFLSSVSSILKSQRISLIFNVGSDRSRCQL